jgi:hypothetical protein
MVLVQVGRPCMEGASISKPNILMLWHFEAIHVVS